MKPPQNPAHHSRRRPTAFMVWLVLLAGTVAVSMAQPAKPQSAKPEPSKSQPAEPAGPSNTIPAGTQPDQPPSQAAAASATQDPAAPDDRRKNKKRSKLKRSDVERLTAALPPEHREFLVDVRYLITDEERDAFLQIEKDYQRAAFIERFWQTRDKYGGTGRNEFKIRWYDRLETAQQLFGTLDDDRAKYYVLAGPPMLRLPFQCTTTVFPLEIWYYRASDKVGYEFFLVFVRKYGRPNYEIFRPHDPLEALFDAFSPGGRSNNLQAMMQDVYTCKDGEIAVAAISSLLNSTMEYDMLLGKIETTPENPSPEWVATFGAYSTDLPEGAALLPARLEIKYPARHQNRTVLEGILTITIGDAARAELGGSTSFNFILTGEVLRDHKLFESFRYRYDMPAGLLSSDEIPLIFERRLRPGSYDLVLKIEDLNSGHLNRTSRAIEVPEVADQNVIDAQAEGALREVEKVLGNDLPTLRIVPPLGQMLVGMQRFDTLTTGNTSIAEVRFQLDGRVVMQKRRPPYSVELDLGKVPRDHVLRISAHDEGGHELASDQMSLNSGRNSFAARLVEPVAGRNYSGSAQVTVDIQVPEGQAIERVELYYNEDLLATLYQEPFSQLLPLPPGRQIGYVRAVAYLPDGNSTEDLVYVNAPDYLEVLQIEYVELYASVVDKAGRPIDGLALSNFAVSEDGQAQEIRRFEVVENLPLHLVVMLDVSASMEPNLSAVQLAALQFFQSTINSKDRGALITFNDHPLLSVDFTNDVKILAGGLAGLKAERGTALYDAMIYSLYVLNGIKGQRAILMLSDGKDESSRFGFEDTLEYARRAGVAIYTIGLGIEGKDSRAARRQLADFADETGGRSFFISSADELAAIYQLIEQELRSRYLITYQSTSTRPDDFRAVDLVTNAPGGEVKTIRGYYP